MEKDITSPLDNAIKSLFGEDIKITNRRRLAGGDINDAFCLELSNGRRIFMKSNAAKGTDFFLSESAGLTAIKNTGTIRVPDPLCTGSGYPSDGGSFLLLEYIEPGARTPAFWKKLGHSLAAMHLADTSKINPSSVYGFFADGYIGSTPQKNRTEGDAHSWIVFFRDYRLLPMLKRTERHFSPEDKRKAARLLERLDGLIAEPDKPSLIHGDLWGGNVMAASDGEPYLIDPAAYVGSREADLAMTELFGGFPSVFYDAYNEAYPLDAGYSERSRIYNLYHLLNHLYLFGTSYLPSVLGVIRRY